jgi:signal transduction histidine kinase
MQDILFIIIGLFILIVGVFSYWESRKFKIDLKTREAEMKRRMYEIAILKELSDRVGYSLNIQNIIDIITGSLHQFIDYSATSYVLIEPEKIIFKAHLEKSVSRHFLNDIKGRIIKSLSALLDSDLSKIRIEEIISGAIIVDELSEPVKSFFNIPLVIANKVVGVLTIAHTKAGLYKEEEMTILYKIVQQASQAVTRLQEVVEIEERKLNAMVESMTEGVVMTDKDYRVVVVNPAVKKIIKIEDKEEITIFDFIDKLGEKFDIRGKLEESVKLDKVLFSNEVLIGERFYQISVSPVKSRLLNSDGDEKLGGVVIFHDVTHEKEVEKMREDFTSMMVHELRSPLDATTKIIDMMKGKRLVKAKRDEYLGMIYNSSSEMLGLVNNLLDVAKIEAGKFQVFKNPTSIRESIKERVVFFETLAKDSNIKLKAVFDENIPAEINFDKQRTSQVLNNFISNSIKYSREGTITTINTIYHVAGANIAEEAAKVDIKWFLVENISKLNQLPNSIVVAVTDFGSGISKDGIDKLFSKFNQIGPNTPVADSKRGSGLGLVVAKGIIESQGGIVGVESKEGEGSTFFFTIPI